MSQPPNPYAAPTAQPSYAPVFADEPRYVRAGLGLRFCNHLVDGLVIFAILALVLRVRAAFNHPWREGEILDFYIMWGGIFLAYYTALESFGGRTLGKMLTGTKAVSANGKRLNFAQALGRSLCRLIPFDWLVTLVGRPFHDTIPGTTVVRTRGKGAIILPPPPGLPVNRPPAPVRPPFNPR